MWEGYSSISAILSQDYDNKTIVFKILHVLAAEDAAAFCCIRWSIWKQRNNKAWNKVTDANAFVLSRAKDSLHEWKLARNLQQTYFVPRQQHGNICWRKPNTGRYKCNIDASFSKHLNKVGLGMCIRDEHGTFVLAKTDWFSPICEVHIREAIGLISALEWVHY